MYLYKHEATCVVSMKWSQSNIKFHLHIQNELSSYLPASWEHTYIRTVISYNCMFSIEYCVVVLAYHKKGKKTGKML